MQNSPDRECIIGTTEHTDPEGQCTEHSAPRRTVKIQPKNRSSAEHSAQRGSAEHSPKGAVQSTVPQKGSAEHSAPEGQCISTMPIMVSAEHTDQERQAELSPEGQYIARCHGRAVQKH